MRDLRSIVSTSYYDMEGDRLELLLVNSHIERLHDAPFSAKRSDEDASLPNLDDVIHDMHDIKNGSKMSKVSE